MALYTRSVPVNLLEDGVERPLTVETLAAEVFAQAGGVEAVKGPRGLQGERGPGVPLGGASGQLLAKASGVDLATAWVDPPASGGAGTTSALRRLGTAAGEAAAGMFAAGHVRHGASGTVARPAGYAVVIWVGSVPPQAGVAGDIWIRTS